MIPKIIFQTHEYEYNDIPKSMLELSKSWIKLNPGYEYVYFSGNQRREYVKNKCPELINFYDSSLGMYQADIWRYFILYENGGVYADMDSICIMSLDNLIKEKYYNHDLIATTPADQYDWIGTTNMGKQEPTPYLSNNANFACKKESNIIKALIDDIVLHNNNNIKKEDWYGIGPITYSKHVLKNKNKVLFEMQNVAFHDGSNINDSINGEFERYNIAMNKLNDPNFMVNYLGKNVLYKNI